MYFGTQDLLEFLPGSNIGCVIKRLPNFYEVDVSRFLFFSTCYKFDLWFCRINVHWFLRKLCIRSTEGLVLEKPNSTSLLMMYCLSLRAVENVNTLLHGYSDVKLRLIHFPNPACLLANYSIVYFRNINNFSSQKKKKKSQTRKYCPKC